MTNSSSPVANFSVLMSVYIKEDPDFLDESLSSIYSSTLVPAEVILVEDGPLTERLEKIIDYYSVNHGLISVKLEKNSGLGIALNAGIAACNYEIIARMDTDDICSKNRFEKQISYMQCHTEVALLGGAIAEYNADFSKKTGVRVVPALEDEILKLAVSRNPFNHMTVMFRKNAIIKCGGYQHHLYMEDYNLWLRLIALGYKVANLPDILVKVRAGSEMISRRRGWNYIKSEFKLMKLKIDLRIGSKWKSISIFLIRALSRYLPTKVLTSLYSALRSRK